MQKTTNEEHRLLTKLLVLGFLKNCRVDHANCLSHALLSFFSDINYGIMLSVCVVFDIFILCVRMIFVEVARSAIFHQIQVYHIKI